MKTILITLLISPMILVSMEKMLIDQKGKEELAASVWPLPSSICAKIAVIKSMQHPVTACAEETFDWRNGVLYEQQAFSKSWLKTKMTPEIIFENQLWIVEQGKSTSFKVRYDNDTTNDCNEFKYKN